MEESVLLIFQIDFITRRFFHSFRQISRFFSRNIYIYIYFSRSCSHNARSWGIEQHASGGLAASRHRGNVRRAHWPLPSLLPLRSSFLCLDLFSYPFSYFFLPSSRPPSIPLLDAFNHTCAQLFLPFLLFVSFANTNSPLRLFSKAMKISFVILVRLSLSPFLSVRATSLLSRNFVFKSFLEGRVENCPS